MHDTRHCQLDVKMTNNYHGTKSIEIQNLSRCKKQVCTTYTSGQKTRHQQPIFLINSYLVMNSLGESSVHRAAPFAQVIKIEYMYKCMHYKDTSSSSS